MLATMIVAASATLVLALVVATAHADTGNTVLTYTTVGGSSPFHSIASTGTRLFSLDSSSFASCDMKYTTDTAWVSSLFGVTNVLITNAGALYFDDTSLC